MEERAEMQQGVPVPYPLPRTRLIGREHERAIAHDRLLRDVVPLLTLTGPGGCGKTRLAQAMAAELGEQFADGIVWVDLASLSDPHLAPATVAQALAIVPVAGMPLEEQLIRTLQPRQTLIVLDNCEHLVEALAGLVSGWLTSCPATQVLATSRAPLRVRGEHELAVEPFPLPAADATAEAIIDNDSVRLFAERAQAVVPRFRVDAANAGTVADICRQLDGLPLAIELAAARMKVLSPAALLAQMSDRLRLLRGGQRDLPARQRTIRDTIAWSYALLEPRQQALFRRLSIFAGGWSLDAVEAVAGDALASSDDALDEIGLLVDQSLVRRIHEDGEPRFTMLETIREFGMAELAAAGEELEARARHAVWFRDLVDSLDLHHAMQGDAARVSRLVPEQDNLRQALAWFLKEDDALSLYTLSTGLAKFWFDLGQFAEARTWIHLAISNDEEIPVLTRARAWNKAAWLAMCQGELDLAASLRAIGLELAREAGESYLLAEVIFEEGIQAFWRGDLERAETLIAEAQQTLEAISGEFPSASVKAGSAVNLRGGVALLAGNVPLAIELGIEAVARARRHAAGADLGYALCGLGYAQFQQRAMPEATESFVESLALTWDLRDHAFLARLFWALAAVATTDGQPQTAARLIGAADALDARTGSAMWPNDRVLAERCLSELRRALDATTLGHFRRIGAIIPTDEAVAIARHVGEGVLGERRVSEIWQASGAPELVRSTSGGERADAIAASFDALTSGERAVLSLIGEHLPDPDIAAELAIEPEEVDVAIDAMLTKLGTPNRREVAALAARFIDLDPRPAAMPGEADLSLNAANPGLALLTPRELDVLQELADGCTDREIAARLFISRRTASKHVEAILAKLGVHSRGAAVAEANRRGIATTVHAEANG